MMEAGHCQISLFYLATWRITPIIVAGHLPTETGHTKESLVEGV